MVLLKKSVIHKTAISRILYINRNGKELFRGCMQYGEYVWWFEAKFNFLLPTFSVKKVEAFSFQNRPKAEQQK